MKKIIALVFAYFFLALALLGVFLPLLPTVPFLLLSAWFAAKGSERLHTWLYSHPHFGPLLRDWDQQKAIARKHKWLAGVMLALSWLLILFLSESFRVVVGLAVLFSSVLLYVVTRPEPR